MSDSVLRALGYGWSVGVCLVHKMSEKVFDSRNGEEDASFANEKVFDNLGNYECYLAAFGPFSPS